LRTAQHNRSDRSGAKREQMRHTRFRSSRPSPIPVPTLHRRSPMPPMPAPHPSSSPTRYLGFTAASIF
jgi:hypothetical protein